MFKNPKWYQQSGREGDVVISTRIRLARNLKDLPFPSGMSPEQKAELISRVKEAMGDRMSQFQYLDMAQTLKRDALSLVERHLISPEFAQQGDGGLLLSKDESISIMIGEEDHLRMQALGSGMQLDEQYQRIDQLDTDLDSQLGFAFDERLGYLTGCPTNLGTGMRASLMLHLPALQQAGTISQLAETVSKLGLTIRGLYGEGSQSEGDIYQLSNQITLGISEQAAIENLKGIAMQVIQREREARKELAGQPQYEDRIWRALGILQTARVLSHSEFMTLVSHLRVGVSLGMIPNLTLDTLNELMNNVQPATIMMQARKDLTPEQRDLQRAKLVRETLSA